jgi:carbonic anhydrase/acetyltransferase-like protein (isoleucine patch superfamily)
MIYTLGDKQPIFEGEGHFIAPNATIVGTVCLQAGASVWFNAVLRGDNDWIRIGEMSNVQDGSVLHTDPGIELVVGNKVTIGHQVTLHGCKIGDGSLIGIGSTILNNARIGRNCLVAANALVTEGSEFPDGVLILGAPAKTARDLKPAEIEMLEYSARVYTENARRYREQLALAD